ncbi:MAG: MATE family efflux transporter [Sphaerochaetaceae bacterium]|nr:MATE family efflux transporter [Sphaerochaetaceae bacterium]
MRSRSAAVIKYTVPTILGSICFFLFTIVDGIFVGHGVGTDALGAVNIVMPFVMVVNALFMLSSIGGVTIVAVRIGRGDIKGANQAFMHALLCISFISFALSAIGLGMTDKVSRLLGANATYHEMVMEYLFWYSVFIIPSGLSTAFQAFCRNDGSPVIVSTAVIAGSVLNIFGDWLMVFPLQMGLKGAAIATGVSQTVTLLVLLTHFFQKKGQLRIRRFTLEGKLLRKIMLRGLPECISQFSTPVSTLCMNYVLLRMLGNIGVNSFSIISYVASFSVAIFFGTGEGLQPLIGQSFGAKNYKDMNAYYHIGEMINFFGSIAINLLLLVWGGSVCRLFGSDEATLAFTVKVMPQYAWGFTVMALNTMTSAYLYSTKRTKSAIIINVLRSFIANSLVIILLPMLFGNGIVWYTFGIYELIVAAVAIPLTVHEDKKLLASEHNA